MHKYFGANSSCKWVKVVHLSQKLKKETKTDLFWCMQFFFRFPLGMPEHRVDLRVRGAAT